MIPIRVTLLLIPLVLSGCFALRTGSIQPENPTNNQNPFTDTLSVSEYQIQLSTQKLQPITSLQSLDTYQAGFYILDSRKHPTFPFKTLVTCPVDLKIDTMYCRIAAKRWGQPSTTTVSGKSARNYYIYGQKNNSIVHVVSLENEPIHFSSIVDGPGLEEQFLATLQTVTITP